MQLIDIRDFENQSFSAVLGGERYLIGLRWNGTCGYWTISFAQGGVDIVSSIPLVENGLILTGLECFPSSFGGIYLEVVNDAVSGSDALISGAQLLWFYRSVEVYSLYGTVDP